MPDVLSIRCISHAMALFLSIRHLTYRVLVQAVIHFIEGDRNRAKECYEEFQDIRSRFHYSDAAKEGSPLYGVVNDFQVFEKIVINLKKEIEHAHKTQQAKAK